jgi:proton-dependent oligopeptide transporter, POT family
MKKKNDCMNQTADSKGHPKGLYVLFATEMWERFNFYGMRAMLVLFMTKALLYNDVFSSNLYGSYISLIYLSPLVGGYIADRYWGNKRSILVGGIVMAVGELILFACGTVYHSSPGLSTMLFFSGLGFMIAGNGFFKPNISSLVGQLYKPNDTRKDSAYTIFYMGINIGGMAGPLVCGFFGDTGNPADFKWAFLIGAIAMVISLIVQKLYHDKYVKTPEGKILGLTPGADHSAEGLSSDEKKTLVPPPPKAALNPVVMILATLAFAGITIGAMYLDTKIDYLFYLLIAAFLFVIFLIFSDKNLTKEERQRIWVMIIIAVFVVFFWGAYEQTGASLVFFADRQTDRNLWGDYIMPTSYFQSVNSAFIIIFAAAFAWIWLKMGKKQPATPTKMGLGLIFLALGYLWIAYGVKLVGDQKASIVWLTGLYLLHTWGELCLSPIGLSLFNKLSPLRFASLLMAVWFLGNAGGNKLAGVLSALYPQDGNTTTFLGYHLNNTYDFFMLFVFMCGIAGIILLLLSKKLQKMMHGIV